MISCCIIGFSYDHKKNDDTLRKYLSGCLIDLYRAYKRALLIKASKICIITDIIKDIHHLHLSESVKEGIIDSEIFDFISTLKNKYIYRNYIGKINFIENIIESCKNSDYMFIYYTGHVHNNKILLPLGNCYITFNNENIDNNNIDLEYFKNIFLNNAKNTCDFIFIMDCCNSNGLNLPYMLQNRVYRLYTDIKKCKFIEQRVICFSSSRSIESSISCKYGSPFSSYFFEIILKERYIDNVLNYINNKCSNIYNQTATVTSSYPNILIIWRWFFNGEKIEVKIDWEKNVIIMLNKMINDK